MLKFNDYQKKADMLALKKLLATFIQITITTYCWQYCKGFSYMVSEDIVIFWKMIKQLLFFVQCT